MEGKDHNNRSGGRGGRQRERELGERQKERVGGGGIGFGNAVRDFQNAVEMRQVKNNEKQIKCEQGRQRH